MAKNIKGLTIEIGGDTAPLSQALKDVNKEIGTTQKELKDVEKLLKLDPHNTELLADKQKLLAQAVSQTSTKLDALKKAKADADEKMKNGTEVNSQEYRALQKEIITTQAQLKKYNDEIDESRNKIDLLGKSATDMNSAMRTAGAGILAVGAGLVGLALKAGKTADEINTLSKQTGLSVEEIQKFKYASETIDVSLETLTGSMSKLIKSMSSASSGSGATAEAFKTLGIEVKDAQGNLRNNQDVFKETIKALGQVENETQRDAIAMQIFGKSAQDLNPLIKGGADELEALGQKAEEMGLILSQDTLDSANQLQDGLDMLKATASASFTQIGAEMTQYLIPVVEKLGDLIRWILDNKSAIVTALASISAGIAAFNMVTMIQSVVTAIQKMQAATEGMTVAQAALNVVMKANPLAIVISLVVALGTALATLIVTNENFRNNLVNSWYLIKQTAIDVFEKVAKFFKEDIPNAFRATMNFLEQHWKDILLFIVNPIAGAINLLYELNPKFREWVDNIIDSIKAWFGRMTEVGKNIVEGIWEGIQNAKDWLLNKIKEWCGSILNGIKSFFGIESPSKVMANEVGKYMADGIGIGFSKEIPSVIDEMEDKLSTVTDSLRSDIELSSIPQLEGNQIISENQYVTKNFNNTVETIRQPSVIELVLDDTKVARAIIPALDSEYNRLGVKV